MTDDELEALKIKNRWLALQLVAFCWLEDDGKALAEVWREFRDTEEEIARAMMPPKEQEGDSAA